jgi:hypothetical protein
MANFHLAITNQSIQNCPTEFQELIKKMNRDDVFKYESKFQYGPPNCEFIMNFTPFLETIKQKLPNTKKDLGPGYVDKIVSSLTQTFVNKPTLNCSPCTITELTYYNEQ